MNIVFTSVTGTLRGVCVAACARASIYGTSLANRSLSSKVQPEQEEEDVLYERCEIECRGVDPAVLKSYSKFAHKTAEELGITAGESITPRKANKKRWTVLKSVFIHNKHRVQYEVRTYFHTMNFLRLTGSTADTFLEYVQRNLPEGVALKVTKVRLERLPEHLKSSPNVSMPEEEKKVEESPPNKE